MDCPAEHAEGYLDEVLLQILRTLNKPEAVASLSGLWLQSPAERVGEITMNLYEVGQWRKKWFVSENTRNDHEAEWTEPASHILNKSGGHDIELDCHLEDIPVESMACSCVISVPYHEFAQLVYDLPEFEDLPLFWNAWITQGRPTSIIVLCIMDGDMLAIDTSGYDYARYRASCKQVLPVVQ